MLPLESILIVDPELRVLRLLPSCPTMETFQRPSFGMKQRNWTSALAPHCRFNATYLSTHFNINHISLNKAPAVKEFKQISLSLIPFTMCMVSSDAKNLTMTYLLRRTLLRWYRCVVAIWSLQVMTTYLASQFNFILGFMRFLRWRRASPLNTLRKRDRNAKKQCLTLKRNAWYSENSGGILIGTLSWDVFVTSL